MKRIFAALVFLLFGTFAANAQGAPCQWSYGFVGGVATATYCGNVAVNGSINQENIVPSTAALEAIPDKIGAILSTILKVGYYNSGDMIASSYSYSASPCSNSGLGDGGSQFPTPNGNCWILGSNQTPTAKMFGAKGDHTTDDEPFFANLFAYAITSGQNPYIGPAPVQWTFNEELHIDYFRNPALPTWQILWEGAVVDGTSIQGTPVFVQTCGGTPGSKDSSDCSGVHEVGSFRFNGASNTDFTCQFGYSDMRDVQQRMIIDAGYCNNSSSDPRAGGAIFFFPTTDDLNIYGDVAAGGGAGVENNEGYSAGRAFAGISMTRLHGGSTGYYNDLIEDSPFSSASNNTKVAWEADNDIEGGVYGISVMPGTILTASTFGGIIHSPRAFNVLASSKISGNLIANPSLSGLPYTTGTIFGAMKEGYGTSPAAIQPYGATYSLSSSDDGDVFSSSCSQSGPQINIFPSVSTAIGNNQVFSTDASAPNVQVGYIATIIGFPSATVTAVNINTPVAGTTEIVLSSNATSATSILNSMDFRPASCPSGTPTPQVYTLPNCSGTSAIDLNGKIKYGFITGNNNNITLNVSGTDKIFTTSGTEVTTFSYTGSSNGSLTCFGNGLWFQSATIN